MGVFIFLKYVIINQYTMIEEVLQKVGLSEKMSKVYGAVLEFGPQTAQQIAQKISIPRPTVYVQIISLTNKGLMSKVERGNKTYFIAESPENLERLLEEKMNFIKSASVEFKKTLSQLNTLFLTAEDKPKIRFFEGKEGLLTMIKDFKTSRFESVEEFVSLDKAFEMVPPKENDFRQKLTRKFRKVPMRVIYTSKNGPILKAKEGSKERRFVPPAKFPYSGSITIYGSKIALMAENRHLVGTIIENHEIANTLRSLFNFAWDSTKVKDEKS